MTESILLWIVIILEAGQPPRPSFKTNGYIDQKLCTQRAEEVLQDLSLFDRTGFKVYCTRQRVYYSVNISINEQ